MYGFKRVVIPHFYRDVLEDEQITDDFISSCLQILRFLGEDVPNGQIEFWDVLDSGDIEVYIEL